MNIFVYENTKVQNYNFIYKHKNIKQRIFLQNHRIFANFVVRPRLIKHAVARPLKIYRMEHNTKTMNKTSEYE